MGSLIDEGVYLGLFKMGILGDGHGFSPKGMATNPVGASPTGVAPVSRRAHHKKKKNPKTSSTVAAVYGCLDYERPGAWSMFGSVGRPKE
jgi:hypothetical protein